MSARGRVLLAAEGAWLVLVAAVLLVGDRSHPVVTSVPTQLAVDAPLVISFDRPVDHASAERGFSLRADEQAVAGRFSSPTRAVAGRFSWSTRALAFTPSRPLTSDTTYTLELAGLTASDSGVLRTPFRASVHTTPARFLYVSPARTLRSYAVVSRADTPVGDLTGAVVSYDASADGQLVLVSTEEATQPPTERLSLLEPDPKGTWHTTELSRSALERYRDIHICDAGQYGVAFHEHLDARGDTTATDLVAIELSVRPAVVMPLLNPPQPVGGDVLTCAPRSDSFLYRNRDGNIVQRSRGAGRSVVLGQLETIDGFSLTGDAILFEHQIHPELSTNRMVFSVDSRGQVAVLSDPAADAVHPSQDPAQTMLAVADVPSDVSGASNRLLQYRIHISGDVEKVLSPPASRTDDDPTFSRDGRLLAFVQHDLTSVDPATLGDDARRLDGAIWLVAVRSPRVTDDVASHALGITGGMVEWLP